MAHRNIKGDPITPLIGKLNGSGDDPGFGDVGR